MRKECEFIDNVEGEESYKRWGKNPCSMQFEICFHSGPNDLQTVV